MTTLSKVTAAGLVVAFTVGGAGALAFTRSTTDKGKPVFWPSSCAYIQPDTANPTDVTAQDLATVIAHGIANWRAVDSGCSYFDIIEDPPASSETLPDYKNVVKFRTGDPAAGARFCRPASKDKDGGYSTGEICYTSSATAITTVFYTSNPGKANDGAIWDADIELNDIDFTFILAPTTIPPVARPNTTLADLENTLTHELGHFQGLDHTCWDHQSATAPLDGNGHPIPDCADVTPTCKIDATECKTITGATMFNYAKPGEVSKRMPEPDDVAGVCTIYPKAQDPMSCMRSSPHGATEGCSCSHTPIAPSDATGLALTSSLLFIAMVGIRRRRKA